MGRRIGCLVLLLLIAWLGLEVFAYIGVSRFLNHHFERYVGSGGYILVLAWIGLSLVVGYKVGRWHVARVMPGLLKGTAGGHVVGVLGAILIGLPGLLSDIPGIILLLPPVQSLFSKLGAAVMASVVKRSMGKMFGGGIPGGLPPGFSGSPFPGMKAMTPDDKALFGKASQGKVPHGKPGKTYDTTVEKDEPPKL